MKLTYTTRGSVRGGCGHAHKSIGAAYACFLRDSAGCKRQGGYSDRRVVRTDGEPMTAYECRELDDAEQEQ